ncbi:glycoside hydrolase family 95 protein [Edaphobacter albus]|uniref:glycoside hydrolase family 95 protein n=1 Tax=Edaphobacter sp. 4G125 TaxID=2763071 RepID=UPI00210735D9|nr:glycoside hydrolase family 95 protein [Edaphobacter sp. 4G125]
MTVLPSGMMKLSPKDTSVTHELWYTLPASRWLEALPVGNGRLGGMIFGGVDQERLALSESTAWSGSFSSTDMNPEAREHIPRVRQLLFDGKYVEARELCQKYLLVKASSFGTNLPLPELHLNFQGKKGHKGYRRSLNLDEAVARVEFQQAGVQFQREVLASHPDSVIAIRLTANRSGKISFDLGFGKSNLPIEVLSEGKDLLLMRGHAYERLHSSGHDGVTFQIRLKVLLDGGDSTALDQGLKITDANAVTILVAVATSFMGEDPEVESKRTLELVAKKSYLELKRDHIADHQRLFRRVSLDLGTSSHEVRTQSTDVRRKNLEGGTADPELLALFFQYGRYLTIAGSRTNSPLPLALQGIWNDGLASSMGWTDDFHLDINTEQNYWAAEVCNLSECQTPLWSLIDGLRQSGRRTAQEMYGAPGWVCHTVTNAWQYTAPGAGLGWGLFVTGGVWIALQMWEHYAFTRDIEFLRTRAYPVFREAAQFFLAYMVPEPRHGWLVTGPSDSPENWYLTPDGQRCAESMGNTCDRVLVYALFSKCIESSLVLDIDKEFRSELEAARSKLPPFQIGRHGQVQEWLEDFEDAEPNHRHTSHLIALYPEDQISPRTTPALARAAEVTIQRRMNAPNWEQSEWGRANLVLYHARLLKGDLACKYLVGLLAKATDDNLLTFSSGGVAGAEQNIFAVDGNTAGTAGIAEMLLQSQAGELHLLPALPAAWPAGRIHGLCARGGYRVDMEWRNGTLLSAAIYSQRSGKIPVRYGNRVLDLAVTAGQGTRLTSKSFS